ncbi:DUF1189 family protein [Candidatus Woesearchaeota archaeon]|nr:DUF1189 family protein [Candidatus Woesearchaeota archaeon]
MIKKTLVTAKNTAGFFLAVANAFNPLYYRAITQKPLGTIIGHVLYLLLIIVLLTAATVLPSLQLKELLEIRVKAALETKEPIQAKISWLGNTQIFVNTTVNEKEAEKYDLALSSSELRSKPALCFFRNEVCQLFGVKQGSIPISELNIGKAGKASSATLTLLAIMLPGLLILLYLSLAVKYLALAIAAAAIGYIAIKVTKRDTGMLDTIKIAAYSMTALAVLDFAAYLLQNSPVKIPAFAPLLAYLAILAVALFLHGVARVDDRI